MKLARCDKKTGENTTCRELAYAEVYWNLKNRKDGEMGHWSYLCKRHYLLDWFRNFLFRWGNGYAILDTEGYEDCFLEDEPKAQRRVGK